MQGIERQFHKKILFVTMFMTSLLMTQNVFASQSYVQGLNNEHQSREYRAEIIEEFESPARWQPGVTINKDVHVVNKGTAPVFVKAQINLEWFGQDEITREKYALTFKELTTGAEEYAALISWGREVVLLSKGATSKASLKFGLPEVANTSEAQGKWVLLDEKPDEEGNLNFEYIGTLAVGQATPLLIDHVQMNPKIEAKTMGTQTIYNKVSKEWETQYRINPSYSYENAKFLLTVKAWIAQVTDDEVEEVTPIPTSSPTPIDRADNPKQISQPKTGDESVFISYIMLASIAVMMILVGVYFLKKRQKRG